MSDHSPSAAGPSKAILPIIVLAIFVLPLSISGTAIALPKIASELGSSPALLQWVVNGFNVAFALFTLVWGGLSDRLGYRTTFRAGVALVLLAAVASAWAPNLLLLDIARIVAGIGGAAVLTGASAIISNAYEGAARGRAFAIFGTVIGLGLALGPTVSGTLIASLGWREVFMAHGAVLVIALLGTFALPHIKHQIEAGRKLLDFSLLANPLFTAMLLVPVAGALGYVTLLTYLPNAFSGILAMDAGTAGLVMLPMTVPVLVGPILAAKLMSGFKMRPMSIIYASLVFLMLGALGMLWLNPGAAIAVVMIPMVLVGLGFGLPLGLVDGEALASVPANQSGAAAGMLNFFRVGSEALFVGLYAAFLAYLIGQQIADPALADATAAGQPGQAAIYAAAFHWLAVILAALVGVTTVLVGMLHHARTHAKVAHA